MVGWFVRILLLLSGFIAGWLVPRDALNFPVIQMVVGMALFVILVAAIALWPHWRSGKIDKEE